MLSLQNTKARPVGGVSFGPGGQTLVAGGSGGYDVWDLTTSARTFVRSHSVKYLYGCVYDPRGRWVYVSDYLGGFRLLPLGGREAPPAPGSPHERHVPSFDLTPDGGRLVMSRGGAGTNRVELWDIRAPAAFVPAWSVRDGAPVAPDEPYLLNQSSWFTNGVALSPDGKLVATAEHRPGSGTSEAESVVALRDGATGRPVVELATTAAGFGTRWSFAPDSRTLFAWDHRVLQRWDVVAGQRTGQVTAPGRAYFRGLAIHPSGRVVVTASGDGQARYWDAASLSPVRALKWGVGRLHAVAFSPDGALAAAGGEKGQVVVWDMDE